MKMYTNITREAFFEKYPMEGDVIEYLDTVLLYNMLYYSKNNKLVGVFDRPKTAWASDFLFVVAETEEEFNRLMAAFYHLKDRNDSYEDGYAILSDEELAMIKGEEK